MTAVPRDIRQLLADAVVALPGEEGRQESERLLLHVLDKPRSWLFAHATDAPDPAAAEAFDALLARRVAGEPVAYLLGHRGFWTLDLAVSPATLIPRPETELLVELALAQLPVDTALAVADLGTGSGAIALALASERPQITLTATDASAAALAVARANAARHGLDRVRFVHGNWFEPLHGQRFDLIVSNPPYIASTDPHLLQGDLRHEPASALASGIDGLDDIAVIVAGAPAHLRAGGWLLVEHGWDQGAAIRRVFDQAGFEQVRTARDLEHRDRVTCGCLPGLH